MDDLTSYASVYKPGGGDKLTRCRLAQICRRLAAEVESLRSLLAVSERNEEQLAVEVAELRRDQAERN